MSYWYRLLIQFVTMMRNGHFAVAIHEFLVYAQNKRSTLLVTVYRIMRAGKDGDRTSFEDSLRSGRPNSAAYENVRLIQGRVEQDRCVSIHQIASGIDISSSTVHSILHNKSNNLHLRSLCAKWIQKDQSDEQKAIRVNSTQEFTVLFENHDLQKLSMWIKNGFITEPSDPM